jgi:esterase
MLEPAESEQHLREVARLANLPLEEVVLPTDGELVSNGLRFHYLDWGTAGREPVLFLHGGGLTAHTWDLVCLGLRRQYHCRALELRGHGDSEWAPDADYSLETQCVDLEGIVEHFGSERFTLVGMSLGGAISLTYAGKHADKLNALVLVDVGPNTRPAGRQRIADFVSGPRELDSVEAFVERALTFNPRRRPEILRRSLLHNLRQTPTGTWTWKYDYRRYGGTDDERARRSASLWAAVPRVTCPTLVVRGSESDVFLDEDARTLADALPHGSWIQIEGAGHTVQGDRPKALVDALGRFFGEVVPQTA